MPFELQEQLKGILIVWAAATVELAGVEGRRPLAPSRERRCLTAKSFWMAEKVVALTGA